jgi:Holliday junction resolvase-like predicted endonuclease
MRASYSGYYATLPRSRCGFDSHRPLRKSTRNYPNGRIAQLIRAFGLHPKGPRFESWCAHKFHVKQSMIIMERNEIGKIGEITASNYLIHRNYRIIHRNFHMGHLGEMDIVAEKRMGFWPFQRKILVFVEVKTLLFTPNSAAPDFLPEMHVNNIKKMKLIKLGYLYLQKNHINLDSDWQIDVIGVELDRDGKLINLRHHENAISQDDCFM